MDIQEAVRPGKLTWCWNTLVVGCLAYESVEKFWELSHTVTTRTEVDTALYLIIAVNVLNHVARISDVRHRFNKVGLLAIAAGLLLAAFGLWWMWPEITRHG